jgi:hypothetical protein
MDRVSIPRPVMAPATTENENWLFDGDAHAQI